jgi:hypothetical protein
MLRAQFCVFLFACSGSGLHDTEARTHALHAGGDGAGAEGSGQGDGRGTDTGAALPTQASTHTATSVTSPTSSPTGTGTPGTTATTSGATTGDWVCSDRIVRTDDIIPGFDGCGVKIERTSEDRTLTCYPDHFEIGWDAHDAYPHICTWSGSVFTCESPGVHTGASVSVMTGTFPEPDRFEADVDVTLESFGAPCTFHYLWRARLL